jgi:hypothetical protein
MDKHFKNEKKEVPQIHTKTGVSQDYWNMINSIVSHYKMKRGGVERVKEFLIKRGTPFEMKKYEDLYSGYNNIVNDKNRESIKRLDELVVLINETLKDPNNINDEILRKTCNEIHFLIYGDNDVEI